MALEHGFTRVDEEQSPSVWVECLDAMQREPFYRDYKRRVREILAPRPSGLYLDVGAGAGTDALALGAPVIAVDRSLTMCRECRSRGQRCVIMADAEALPLELATVDGCWADRTFQHLASPRRALEELLRVMKPGSTIVVVDPDYSTQTMTFPDQDLARQVFRFRAEQLLRNGTLAHRMHRMFAEAGVRDVSVEERRLVVRDPAAVDHVMGLRSWARTARDRRMMTDDEAARWEALYDRVVDRGEFMWSVSFFITSGRKSGVVSV